MQGSYFLHQRDRSFFFFFFCVIHKVLRQLMTTRIQQFDRHFIWFAAALFNFMQCSQGQAPGSTQHSYYKSEAKNCLINNIHTI